MNWRFYKIALLVLTLYLIVYSVVFHEFLINPLLPGHFDSWYQLALLCDYSSTIKAWLSGNEIIVWANYPEGQIYRYGGPTFLSIIPFMFFQGLTSDDRLSFILLYVLVFVLNSFSLFLLMLKSYRMPIISAAIVPLFFCLSAFHLGNIENFTYLIFFPSFLSLVFYDYWRSTGHFGYLLLSALCLGSQLYFAVYNFVMGGIILFVWMFCSERPQRPIGGNATILLLIIILALPFVYLYQNNSIIPEAYHAYFTVGIIDSLGFSINDFTQSFATNPVYGSQKLNILEHDDYWRLGNPGLIFGITAITGLFLSLKKRCYEVALLLSIGFVLAMGPLLGPNDFPSPTYYFYEVFDFIKRFKLIFKFYHLVLVGFVLAASYTFYRMEQYKFGYIGCFIITILFLFENLPADTTEYSNSFSQQLAPQPILEEMQSPEAITLILPAYTPALTEKNEYEDCLPKGRKWGYQLYYYAVANRFQTVNGANGFIPRNRLKVHNLLQKMPLEDALEVLKKRYDVSYVLYNDNALPNCKKTELRELVRLLPQKKNAKGFYLFDLRTL